MANSSSNETLTSCPAPFLNFAHYPSTGGDTAAVFCGQISPTLSCCLPCPLEQWIYSDSLPFYVAAAQWFNVPALVCQVFLLLTFAVLPSERAKVQGRYLSVGLVVGLVLLELAFIIPLGTKPDFCYNAITPNDMYTNASCAWTGALLELGSMAGCVWILLRSLYTHLRVCWDVQLTKRYVWIAHGLGWGLPALFLAVSLPITKLSYRLTSTCLPNPHASFVTWFGWLIAFALLGALIQFATTGFCLVVFMRSFLAQSNHKQTVGTTRVDSIAGLDSNNELAASGARTPTTPTSHRRLAWRRVKHVLGLQWRSIVLSFIIIIDVVYSGIVYVLMTGTEDEDHGATQAEEINNWSECLIQYNGDKTKCLSLAAPLRIGEAQIVATLLMASLIGIFTFCLMIRWSMVVGWWELIRHPRRRDSIDFELQQPRFVTKHMSLSRPLASEQAEWDAVQEKQKAEAQAGLVEVLPEPVEATTKTLRPEEPTLFDFGLDEEERKEKEQAKRDELDDVV